MRFPRVREDLEAVLKGLKSCHVFESYLLCVFPDERIWINKRILQGGSLCFFIGEELFYGIS